MAGRSAHVRRVSTEARRRSSSHGDATPRVPAPAHLALPPLPRAPSPNSLAIALPSPPPSLSASSSATAEHAPKRLGFLGDIADMLQLPSAGHGLLAVSSQSPSPASVASSAQRSATMPIPSSLLPTRTHSRGDSAFSREGAQSPLPSPSMATPLPTKVHTSPSKASSTRTYDSKLVSREMHRLGNLAHLPSLAPSISAAQSTISLNMAPASAPGNSSTLPGDAPWTNLHVLVLPLFNGEPLRYPIEELNGLVKRHISTVVSAAPGKALATLEHDTLQLIGNGMVTLNSKLPGVEDEKLVARVVELWTFFWGQVLPYLEGSLLPLQTEPILSALSRVPKTHRPSSPTATQNGKSGSNILLQSTATQIDVRALALMSFRDRVILPLFPRLHTRLTMSKDENVVGPESQQARLQQMLLVLVSQRQRLPSLSLTAPPPQPSAGEAAIARLLRAVHAPLATLAPRHPRTSGAAPSFLSAGLPRDRRGRIAQKAELPEGSVRGSGRGRDRWRMRSEAEEDERWGGSGGGWGAVGGGSWVSGWAGSGDWDEGEADTPRVGVTFADPMRERDMEFLESLRSPDPESSTQMSTSGWVLGGGKGEHQAEDDGDEEENTNMDWDQAQAMVEHMVGMKGEASTGSGLGAGAGAGPQQDARKRT